MMTAEQFTAWSMCPSCKLVDCHSLRQPRSYDPHDPLQVAFDKIVMMQWINGFGLEHMSPSQEQAYEVIRTCRCGHEWGQEPIRGE